MTLAAAEMQEVEPGQWIVGENHQPRAGRAPAERLLRAQHGQRTFQTAKIEPILKFGFVLFAGAPI